MLLSGPIEDLQKANPLRAEIEEGNHEYKFKLTNLSEEQINHRITQLNWRLNEGGDEAVYQIGFEDNGRPLGITREELEESLSNLKMMADIVGCRFFVRNILRGDEGLVAEVSLCRLERLAVSPVREAIAFVGDAGAGKSTLIGVLSTGELDNGSGSMRMQVFQHDHEVRSGHTSSLCQRNLFFDADGNVMNESHGCGFSSSGSKLRTRSRSDLELVESRNTQRVVALLDLAGHSRYLKTTLYGLVSRNPNYCMVCISAKRGVVGMTSEHIGLALALRLPLLIAVTKVDLVSVSASISLAESLASFLSTGDRKVVVIQTIAQVTELRLERLKLGISGGRSSSSSSSSSSHLSSSSSEANCIVPIFLLSNVTGRGLDILQKYIFHILLAPITDVVNYDKEANKENNLREQQRQHLSSGVRVNNTPNEVSGLCSSSSSSSLPFQDDATPAAMDAANDITSSACGSRRKGPRSKSFDDTVTERTSPSHRCEMIAKGDRHRDKLRVSLLFQSPSGCHSVSSTSSSSLSDSALATSPLMAHPICSSTSASPTLQDSRRFLHSMVFSRQQECDGDVDHIPTDSVFMIDTSDSRAEMNHQYLSSGNYDSADLDTLEEDSDGALTADESDSSSLECTLSVLGSYTLSSSEFDPVSSSVSVIPVSSSVSVIPSPSMDVIHSIDTQKPTGNGISIKSNNEITQSDGVLVGDGAVTMDSLISPSFSTVRIDSDSSLPATGFLQRRSSSVTVTPNGGNTPDIVTGSVSSTSFSSPVSVQQTKIDKKTVIAYLCMMQTGSLHVGDELYFGPVRLSSYFTQAGSTTTANGMASRSNDNGSAQLLLSKQVPERRYLSPLREDSAQSQWGFSSVRVRSIRVSNIPVRAARAGQCITITLSSSAYNGTESQTFSSEACMPVPPSVPPSTTVLVPAEHAVMSGAVRDAKSTSGITAQRPAAGMVLLSPHSYHNHNTHKNPSIATTPASGCSSVDATYSEAEPVDAGNPSSSRIEEGALSGSSTLEYPVSATLSGEILEEPEVAEALVATLSNQISAVGVITWEFTAELLALNLSAKTKIRIGYEPMVHIGAIRQSARIISIVIPRSQTTSTSANEDIGARSKESLNIENNVTKTAAAVTDAVKGDVAALANGEKGVCRFRFLYFPEYVSIGSDVIIREESTRGVGKVMSA